RSEHAEVTRRKWSMCNVSFSDGFSLKRRYVDEEATVYHRADRLGVEAGGTGSAGSGFDPPHGDIRADFLSLEAAIWRAGIGSGSRVEAGGGGEWAAQEA